MKHKSELHRKSPWPPLMENCFGNRSELDLDQPLVVHVLVCSCVRKADPTPPTPCRGVALPDMMMQQDCPRIRPLAYPETVLLRLIRLLVLRLLQLLPLLPLLPLLLRGGTLQRVCLFQEASEEAAKAEGHPVSTSTTTTTTTTTSSRRTLQRVCLFQEASEEAAKAEGHSISQSRFQSNQVLNMSYSSSVEGVGPPRAHIVNVEGLCTSWLLLLPILPLLQECLPVPSSLGGSCHGRGSPN